MGDCIKLHILSRSEEIHSGPNHDVVTTHLSLNDKLCYVDVDIRKLNSRP